MMEKHLMILISNQLFVARAGAGKHLRTASAVPQAAPSPRLKIDERFPKCIKVFPLPFCSCIR